MKKYVENRTANTLYVGGCAIAPGEGREVDVPSDAPAVAVTDEPDPDAPLHELLAGNVSAVKAALPELSAEALTRLAELEQDHGKNRVGVLTAIADAQIALADAKLTSDPI